MPNMGWLALSIFMVGIISINGYHRQANLGFDELNDDFAKVFVRNIIESGVFGTAKDKDFTEIIKSLMKAITMFTRLHNEPPSQKRTLMTAFASELAELIVAESDGAMSVVQKTRAVTNALRHAYREVGEVPNEAFIEEVDMMVGIFLSAFDKKEYNEYLKIPTYTRGRGRSFRQYNIYGAQNGQKNILQERPARKTEFDTDNIKYIPEVGYLIPEETKTKQKYTLNEQDTIADEGQIITASKGSESLLTEQINDQKLNEPQKISYTTGRLAEGLTPPKSQGSISIIPQKVNSASTKPQVASNVPTPTVQSNQPASTPAAQIVPTETSKQKITAPESIQSSATPVGKHVKKQLNPESEFVQPEQKLTKGSLHPKLIPASEPLKQKSTPTIELPQPDTTPVPQPVEPDTNLEPEYVQPETTPELSPASPKLTIASEPVQPQIAPEPKFAHPDVSPVPKIVQPDTIPQSKTTRPNLTPPSEAFPQQPTLSSKPVAPEPAQTKITPSLETVPSEPTPTPKAVQIESNPASKLVRQKTTPIAEYDEIKPYSSPKPVQTELIPAQEPTQSEKKPALESIQPAIAPTPASIKPGSTLKPEPVEIDPTLAPESSKKTIEPELSPEQKTVDLKQTPSIEPVQPKPTSVTEQVQTEKTPKSVTNLQPGDPKISTGRKATELAPPAPQELAPPPPKPLAAPKQQPAVAPTISQPVELQSPAELTTGRKATGLAPPAKQGLASPPPTPLAPKHAPQPSVASTISQPDKLQSQPELTTGRKATGLAPPVKQGLASPPHTPLAAPKHAPQPSVASTISQPDKLQSPHELTTGRKATGLQQSEVQGIASLPQSASIDHLASSDIESSSISSLSSTLPSPAKQIQPQAYGYSSSQATSSISSLSSTLPSPAKQIQPQAYGYSPSKVPLYGVIGVSPYESFELGEIENVFNAILRDSKSFVPSIIRILLKVKSIAPQTIDLKYLVKELQSISSAIQEDQFYLSRSELFLEIIMETLIASFEIIRYADYSCMKNPPPFKDAFKYINAFNDILV